MKYQFLLFMVFCHYKVTRCIRTIFLNSEVPLDQMGCMIGCEPDTAAAYINKPWPDQFSYCYRYNARSWHGVAPWLDIIQLGKKADDNERLLEGILYGSYKSGLWIGFQTAETDLISWFAISPYNDPYPVQNWKHQCLMVDLKTGEVSLHLQGKLIHKETFVDIPGIAAKWTHPIEYVGVGSMRRNADVGHMSAPVEFTDVQIYNKILNTKEIQDYADCNGERGEIASWQVDNFVIESARQESTQNEKSYRTEICGARGKSFFHVPFREIYTGDAAHFCKRFDSDLVAYTNKAEFEEVARNLSSAKYLKNSGECVEKKSDTEYNFRFWLDATYQQDTWKTSRGSELSYIPWVKGRPYGGSFTCLTMNLELTLNGDVVELQESSLRDEKCTTADSCPTCAADRPVPTLKLRGLCSQSKLDTVYSLYLTKEGQIVFLGEVNGLITYDNDNKLWKVTDKRFPGEFATISKPYSSMLMGKATLDFENMNDKCVENSESKKIAATFSSCKDGYFTCNDGQCIDIESRCDQSSNCLDGSDEQNCKTLIIKGNYNKKTPPFKLDRLTNNIMKAKINVSVIVFDLLQITEVDLEFTCKFKMILEWMDDRLEFWNLKPQDSSNALNKEEEDQIWLPTLVFSNTEQNDITEGDEKSQLIAGRRTPARLSSVTNVEEINIYDGKDSVLKFQRIYTKTFRCVYDLHMYPFDTQVCTIDLEVTSLEQFGMQLTPEFIKFGGKTVLTQYVVQRWSLEYKNPNDVNEGVHVKLTLRRRLFSEVMTTFLPTTLVLVIVYATNFFKDFFFETVISVNLTALLVLTTLFVSVSSYLPKTAYLKMIDIWLLFAQFIPFFEVLLHTFMDLHRKTDDKDSQNRNVLRGHESHNGSLTTVKLMWQDDSTENTTPKGPSLITVRDVNGLVGDIPTVNKFATAAQLIARDEKEKVSKRADYYEEAKAGDQDKYLRISEEISTKGTLVFFFIFAFIYWTIGLTHYVMGGID